MIRGIQGLLVGLIAFCGWQHWNGIIALLVFYVVTLIAEDNL